MKDEPVDDSSDLPRSGRELPLLQCHSGAREPPRLTITRCVGFWSLYLIGAFESWWVTTMIAGISFGDVDVGLFISDVGGWMLVTLWLVMHYAQRPDQRGYGFAVLI